MRRARAPAGGCKAAKDTLLIANGFSCREQVRQATDRVPLHLSEVIQMALREGAAGAKGAYPERAYITPTAPRPSLTASLAVIAGAALVIGAAYQAFVASRKQS